MEAHTHPFITSADSGGQGYLLQWSEKAAQMLVPSAVTVLHLYRANTRTLGEAMTVLLKNGIPFSLPCVPKTPQCDVEIGSRVVDWKPQSHEDFEIYHLYRTRLLKNDAVLRACLMRGGILWWLAIATIGTHLLDGDTFLVSGSTDKLGYELTKTEEDVLCGVYQVTVVSNGRLLEADKSWFPRPAVWNNQNNVGFWS